MKKLLLLLTLATSAVMLRAQVTFTIHATADATGFGYTAGQSVTFVFMTTAANLSGNAGVVFDSSENYWVEDFTTSTQLFTQVMGTGLAGTYTRPTASTGDPFSVLAAYAPGSNQLTLLASSEAFSSPTIGLTAGGFAVSSLRADLLDWGQSFPLPGTYTSINSFFGSYLGTHTLNPGGYVEFFAQGTPVDFTPTSITISAIPEPSTYAAVLGLAGLAATGWVRRRRRAWSCRNPGRRRGAGAEAARPGPVAGSSREAAMRLFMSGQIAGSATFAKEKPPAFHAPPDRGLSGGAVRMAE